MLEERELLPIITDIDPNTKTISIAKDTIILKDGEIISKSRHRCAFVPGDIERVKEYLGVTSSPEITYLNSIWTADVIEKHNEQ